MKKLLLAATALTAAAGSALAADLPARRMAPPPPMVMPAFTWTGFYIGGNAGYAWSETSATLGGTDPLSAAAVAAVLPNPTLKLKPDGFTGGGQIGYNYQFGNVVLGIEADAQYTDLASTASQIGLNGNRISHRTTLQYLGTVRGRLGYAWDRWLVYGTGGFAYGDLYNRTFGYVTPTDVFPVAVGFKDRTETGYAVGGGVEYAIPNWTMFGSAATVRVEYLHYDLGTRTIAVPTVIGAGPPLATKFKNDGDLVRAGLNFKFGTF
jgi:outer membrane immunogenic protein